MSILIAMNVFMSLILVFMQHPLSMGLILLIQTIIVSLISGNLVYNFWFSYILFLIMVGGMLILFMYMTSIASNEKFKINMKTMGPIAVINLMIALMFCQNNIPSKTSESLSSSTNMEIVKSFSKMINQPMALLLMFVIMYLLITLIATVKISKFKQGPLRQMN